MKDKTNKTVAISEDWKDKLDISEEELQGKEEEEGNVEELEEGKEEDTRSLTDLMNDPEVANKWHNQRTGEKTTEEELLQKAGGKWKKEESEADKIGKAVAKHLNEGKEAQEEELQQSQEEKGKDRRKARQEGSKELPPKWESKLKERGGGWVEKEELQEAQGEEEGSILSEVKENTEVEELQSGKKRIDTTSVRAISEINSLNYEYPDMVNILHTDREKGRMTAIVNPKIKQKLN